MNDALIIYATMHGQAELIARRIGEAALEWGAAATVQDVRNVSSAGLVPDRPVVLVASVHFGRHARSITRFVKKNQALLAERRTAFISVSGDAAAPATRPRAEQYAEDFFRTTGWTPAASLVIGGAVKFTKYNWFLRYLTMRSFAAKGMQLDPRHDYDYTDWETVMRFAKAFLTSEDVKVA